MKKHNQKLGVEKTELDSLLSLYSNGKYNEALEKIQTINESYPGVPIIFNIAGACYKALGDIKASVKMFENAVKLKPDYAEGYKNLGIAFREIGSFDASVESFLSAISIEPSYLEAHFCLADTYFKLSKLEDAIEFYEKTILLKPDFAEAHFNLGIILKDLGRLENAAECFKKTIAINPNLAEAHNNIGVVQKDIGNLNDAIISYDNAIKINPRFLEAHNNLGILFNENSQFTKARDSFSKVIELKPNYAEAHNNLGLVYMKLGQYLEAFNCYKNALVHNPNYAFSHNNLGTVLGVLGKTKASIESYKKAIELKPNYAEAYNNLGNVLRNRKQRLEALTCFEKAYSINPNIDYLFGAILNTKMHLCIWDHFDSDLIRLSEKIMNKERAIGPFALKALLDDPSIQKMATEIFVDDQFQGNFLEVGTKMRQKHSLIRIGYFSADFKIHPISYLCAELFELHDRSKFEIHAFSFTKNTKDKMNIRIKEGVDYFHDVIKASDEEVVKLCRSSKIDIAVDLGGFTANSRTKVFAMSLAPIQINFLGYPGSMHAEYMDYLVADKTLIPEDKQKFYSEKIIYMPNSYQVNIANQNIDNTNLDRKSLGLPEEGFVYCCFNNAYKITPSTFKGWMNILKQVEKSILWLLVSNETAIKNLKNEASNLGIDNRRIVFAPYISIEKHLNRIQYADLFLDTLPYNAHTTSSDALRMGLPVLTLKGKSFASRVAASLLKAVDLPELIVNSQKNYESLAIELGNNPKKCKFIREKLSNNLQNAPLFNTSLYTENLELAYKTIFERDHQRQEYDHIYLEDLN